MAALVYIALVFATLYGWINNIVILAGSTFDPITGLLVLRAIGVFVAPLGIVLGYI